MKCTFATLLIAFATVTAQADHLVVRALDPDGQPVKGLAVRVGRELGGSFVLRREYPRTDVEGRARLEIGEYARNQLEQGIAWEVAARVIAEKRVQVPIPPNVLDGAELILNVPTTGRLLGKVIDTHGTPAGDGYAAFAWRPGPSSKNAGFDPLGDQFLMPFKDGHFESPPVSLGSDVLVRLSLESALSLEAKVFAGPRMEKEQVHIELTTMQDTVLLIQVADVNGAALPNWPVHAKWSFGAERDLHEFAGFRYAMSADRRMRTDEHGVLHLRWDSAFFERFRLGELTIRYLHEDGIHSIGMSARGPAARIQLPKMPVAGETLVGTVRLVPLPLLAEGRVVDVHGSPVPKASIGVRYQRGSATSGHWIHEQRLSIRADEQGRFELRTYLEDVGGAFHEQAHGYRLSVGGGDGFFSNALPFEPGARGLTVVLQEASIVDVEPLIDGEEIAVALQFSLKNEDTGEYVQGMRWLNWERPRWSALRWSAVPEGHYELDVRTRGTNMLVARIEGIQVGTGGTVRDPRLGPLDLRGAVHHVRIAVLDERGIPLEGAHLDMDVGGEVRSLGGRRGLVDVILPAGEPITATVRAEGYRPAQLNGLSDSRDVILRPALEITLRGVNGPERVKLENAPVTLAHTQHSSLPQWMQIPVTHIGRASVARFDLHTEVRFLLPGAGSYTVGIAYPRRTPEPGDEGLLSPSLGMLKWAHVQVEVTEQDDGKTIQIQLPPHWSESQRPLERAK